MARIVDIPETPSLADYEAVAHLAPSVRALRDQMEAMAGALDGRTVWMVNSTETGGGVAEMLPTMVGLMRDLGIQTEWIVLETDRAPFFDLTKRLHNAIHGAGVTEFSDEDRAVFAAVNQENADQIAGWLSPNDILVVHDPQPMPLAQQLADGLEVAPIWRCHIGLDETTAQTEAAWGFLAPYADAYGRAVFSAPEYIPSFFGNRATVLYPAINPLTDKNRDLSLHQITGVLANAALTSNTSPVLTPSYDHVAERLRPDGTFKPANMAEDIGLLTRPIVTQISRWDRLKGFAPLMQAFAELKGRLQNGEGADYTEEHRRRLELVRLVLAGPDPSSVADDPEGAEVLEELKSIYADLPDRVQRDVALIALPMDSLKENALMVNAIQRASSIIVQNSLREGFGLTVTEGMWKKVPVLSNRRACGPRQQVRDDVDGRMIGDPENIGELAEAMDRMLADVEGRRRWGRSAQRRAHEEFMVFGQVGRWLSELENALTLDEVAA